jgi:uncharacterized protein (DUF433 family)
MERKELGQYVVVDPEICHGRPTFNGTRIFVADILKEVAEGWLHRHIKEQWNDSVSREAISEAVLLARQSFLDHWDDYVVETIQVSVHSEEIIAA